LVLFHIRNDEAQVRGYEPFGCFFVTRTSASSEFSLFAGVLNEGVLLYVL